MLSETLLVFCTAFAFLDTSFAYTCSTPDEWLGVAIDHESPQYTRPGTRWTNGVVKYRLTSILEESDIKQFFLAVEEYHKKTCIRFEPYKQGDPIYTNIELDNNVCGYGTVCMRGGYQFARFGGTCRKMNTMVHQLGHNLCLSHEHQRPDRDEYISYSNCTNVPGKQNDSQVRGIYDYESQMHSECGSCNHGGWPKEEQVNRCGPQVTTGLSVLDADNINELYQCEGCFRHRWIPIEKFSGPDKNNLEHFGFVDIDGQTPLYPCRAFLKGKLLIGKYMLTQNVCYVGINDKEYRLSEKFQILTIPGGANAADSEYKVIPTYSSMTALQHDSIYTYAVVAGHLPWADGSGYGNGYVAYCNLPCTDDLCRSNARNSSMTVSSIGNAWSELNGHWAWFPLHGREYFCSGMFILVCRDKSTQDISLPGQDFYTNWKLRHMEVLTNFLQPGATITIVGQLPPNATTFFVDLGEQPAAGSIILHINPRLNRNSDKNVMVWNSFSTDHGWGSEIRESRDEQFPFRPGQAFKLEIICEKEQFLFKVNGIPVGSFVYRQALQDAKFVRIHGDVLVLHVDVDNTRDQICKDGESDTTTLLPDAPNTAESLTPMSARMGAEDEAASASGNRVTLTDIEEFDNSNTRPLKKSTRSHAFGITIGAIAVVSVIVVAGFFYYRVKVNQSNRELFQSIPIMFTSNDG